MPVKIKTFSSLNCNGLKNGTKQALLNDFIKQNDIDICFLQEVNVNLFKCLKGYDFVGNIGKSERGTGIIFRMGQKIQDIICSIDGRIISITVDNIRFVNLYAPSGSQKQKERDEFFKNEITVHLKFNLPLAILGDFNCVTRNKDSTNGTNINKTLYNITQKLNLVDTWVFLNKNKI